MRIIIKVDGYVMELTQAQLETIIEFVKRHDDLPDILGWFARNFGRVQE